MNRYMTTSGGQRPTPSIRRRAISGSRIAPHATGGLPMANCPPGQHLRGGKLIIAIGGPAPIAIGIGLTATIQYQIPESGRLMRLICSSSTGDLFGLTLDALEHNNVNLTSGTVPLEMFADVTVGQTNPVIGRWVLVNDQVQVTITNNTGAAVTLTTAFSVA